MFITRKRGAVKRKKRKIIEIQTDKEIIKEKKGKEEKKKEGKEREKKKE